MAAGDVFSGQSNVAAAAYLTIQPGAGTEAVVTNIVWDGSGVTLEFYNGTTSLVFDTDATAGGLLGTTFHVTNSQYLRVKNTTGAAINIGYDGVYTK